MRKWTEDLLGLQNVDLRIRGLKIKLATIPNEKAKLSMALEDGRGALKAAKETLQKAEQQIKAVEGSIAQVNEEIRKLQTQSMMVKKNDEYQAMMRQIEDCKRRISDFETEEIGLFDKVEESKGGLKAAEKAFSERERSVKSDISEFDQLDADIKKEIEDLSASRKSHESRIESAHLQKYNRLLARGKGEPLAIVKEGGYCANCQLKLTPQTLNEAKGGNLTHCDNCSCIVYMDVPEQAS